jgi:hypothetical protein
MTNKIAVPQKLFYTLVEMAKVRVGSVDVEGKEAIKQFNKFRPSFVYTGHVRDYSAEVENFKDASHMFNSLYRGTLKNNTLSPYVNGTSSSFALPLGRSYASAKITNIALEKFVRGSAPYGGNTAGSTNSAQMEIPVGFHDLSAAGRAPGITAVAPENRHYLEDGFPSPSEPALGIVRVFRTSDKEEDVE